MGVSEGFNSVINAYNLKLNRENMKIRRAEYRLEAAKTKAQLYQQGFDEYGNPNQLAQDKVKALESQIQQQQQQLAYTQKYIMRKDTHDAINNAIATGNWGSINALFELHPSLKKVWDVQSIRNINFNDNNDVSLLKQYGLNEKQIQDFQKNPIDAKKFMQTHFIAIGLDGKQYLKDANKVAAVAGVDPGSYEVYNMAFQNRLKAQSDETEASRGTYGQNDAIINSINSKTQQANTAAQLNETKAQLNQIKGNYYNSLAQNAQTSDEKYKLQMKGIMYDNLQKQINVSNLVNKQQVMDNLPKLIDNIVDYNPSMPKTDKDKLYKDAKLIQGDKPLPDAIQTRLSGTLTAIKTGNQLLDTLKHTNIDINAFNKVNATIMSALPENWAKLTPEQRVEALKRIKIDSAMGEWITKYVQAISGAAVTDNEFVRHYKDAFGGRTFTNTQSAITAFSTYLNSLKHNLHQDINNIAGEYPYSALTYKDRVAKDIDTKPKKSLSDIFGSNK